ncbi:MAG: MopE-related protein, partial [Saprospiraceae bacterium]
GGALFINCVSGNAPSNIDLGFGGVHLENGYPAYEGIVQEYANPIFNGPFTPANGNFSGTYFSYARILGPAGLTLITNVDGTIISLTEKTWGGGKVYFGGLLPPGVMSPELNAQNMWQNILADLNAVCNSTIALPADAGACTATAAAQVLDATATDDCAVVSLTHDFAAAPATNSLDGAVIPVTPALITWTATDAAGNTGTCQFLVAAQEAEVPVITCPDDISVTAEAGLCGAIVTFAATATDNCSLSPAISSSLVSGSLFPNGSTSVQVMATDESGNRSTCTFVVTITGNPEVCNGLDDDCNGLVDDGAPADNMFYQDADYDGYGDPAHSIMACQAPSGYVSNALDCDDTNYYIQPGMYESCNEIDDNCDGQVDEGVSPTWYADTDGDGYGDPLVTKLGCSQPLGYSYDNNDCDDDNAYIHPGAQEDCTNSEDENCDGIVGDNFFTIKETHTDVYCGGTPDGSIQLTIAPSQVYTVIQWSNGACCTTEQTNLQAGTYKVTVTNECGTTKTKTIHIQPSATPALLLSLNTTPITCSGAGDGAITTVVQGGCGDNTYAWNTGSTDAGFSGISGGYYSVVVTDACGCTQTGDTYVNDPYPLGLYAGAIYTLLDGNYWVQVVPYGGTSPYKFRRTIAGGGFTAWSNGNGFADLQPGTYTFEVQDKNGCSAQFSQELTPFSPRPANPQTVEARNTLLPETTTAEPDSSDGTDRDQSAGKVEDPEPVVFPNPTAGELHLEWGGFAEKSAIIQIINNVGQTMRTLTVPAGALGLTANLQELPAGIYFVKILTAGGAAKILRLVKI